MRHPLHPALVHFPIACWSLATFADVANATFASAWIGEPAWRFAGWLLVIGTATALAAMATGFMEFVKLAAEDPRAKHVMRHMVSVLCAWLAYAGSLMLRIDHAALQAPGVAAIGASVVGFALLCAAGWLGGQLVYREGIGVNRCARPGTG